MESIVPIAVGLLIALLLLSWLLGMIKKIGGCLIHLLLLGAGLLLFVYIILSFVGRL